MLTTAPSVKIIDDAKVPAEFKHITVTLPLPQWQELLAGSGEEFRKAVLSGSASRRHA